jgi:hypothetical protein
MRLVAADLKANDAILLELVLRQYFIEHKYKSKWSVIFDLMRMFRMLSAPDFAPLKPDSGGERSAIVIDDD